VLAAVGALSLPAVAVAVPAKVTRNLDAARAPARELERAATISSPSGGSIYRFQQQVSGVDVLNGETVVSDPLGAPPDVVADSSAANVEAPAAPRVGRERALRTASRSIGASGLRGPLTASLAIKPGGGGTLVWRVVVPATHPLGDFEVLVDALTARVIRTRNLLQHFRTGHAQLFDPNPVVMQGGAHPGLASDHHDNDTRRLTRLRVPVALPNIQSGTKCLRGRWAHAELGRHSHDVCKPSLNWNRVTRSDNRFEALMVYFHVNRAQQYIQNLGFSNATGNGIDDRSQVVIADAIKPDNSFFSPGTGKIQYGSGGVDDAEDADVILHEYGHAMQNSQVPNFGTGFEGASIAEGSGDYWAAVMSSLSLHGTTTNTDDVCIFDWDATTWGKFYPGADRFCGRRADDSRNLDQIESSFSCSADVHCVGQAWSSALWDLRKSIGNDVLARNVMDRDYLQAQFLYVPSEHFDMAANALLCADDTLYPTGVPGDCQGEHYAAIDAEMRSRHFLP
jgi:hypothetical protein